MSISSKQFLEKLAKVKTNQASYQKDALCHALNSKGLENTIESFMEVLHKQTPSNPLSFYKVQCPVWGVLTGKSMLQKTKTGYKINAKLTPGQLKEAKKICEGLA